MKFLLRRLFGTSTAVLVLLGACHSPEMDPVVAPPPQPTPSADGVYYAERLLELEVKTIEGQTWRFSEALERRNAVLFAQWAAWCADCLQDLPLLAQLAEEYKDSVEVVTLIGGEQPEKARAALAHRNITLPVLFFPDLISFGKYFPPEVSYRGPPFYVLVGRGGELLYAFGHKLKDVIPGPLDALRHALRQVPAK